MTLGVTLSEHLETFRKEIWQEVGEMIPDSLAPGIVIRAPDKTSARESGDEARREGRVRERGEKAVWRLRRSNLVRKRRALVRSIATAPIKTHAFRKAANR